MNAIPRAELDAMESDLRESVAKNLAQLPPFFIRDAISSFLRVHVSGAIAFCGRDEAASMLREIIIDAGLLRAFEGPR